MKKQQASNTAIYCRLSRDDGGDAESNSIATQRSMLQRYAKEQGFSVYDEYVDDGWSGTQFERPSLKRMLADIEEGKINIVLCKDLSRFGRNNALVAYYTEIVFPDKDVRFIAVNDAIDSAMGDSGGNAVMPFMSVVNEFYARDISKKVRSAKRARALNGEHSGGRVPFGYLKDPANPRKLVVEEETAEIVRRIFLMKADGLGDYQIALRLANGKVKTPGAYEYERTGNYAMHYDPDYPWDWSAHTIDGILRNQVYLGHLVSHKQTTKSFKNNKLVHVPEDEWIIVKNTHQPIVTQDLFDKVAAICKVKRRENKSGIENIFSGLLKCPDCHRRLSLQHYPRKDGTPFIYFNCSSYRHGTRSVETSKCTSHHISWDNLYPLVQAYIRFAVNATLDRDAFIQSLHDDTGGESEVKKSINRLKKREGELKALTKRVFEQNAAGRIDDDTFTDLYGGYQAESKDVAGQLRALEEKATQARDTEANARLFAEATAKYTDAEALTREMLLDLVENIVVHDAEGKGANRSQEVEIYFRFVGKLPQ